MEGGTDDIVHWIEDDIADFGFLSNRHIQALEWISLYEDPLLAVVPKDYPAPENGVIPISDFENDYFIISAMGTDYDVHNALDTAGISPGIRFTSKDDHAIISMIENRLGISILPELVTRNFENQVSTYLLEPYFYRELGIAMKSKDNLSPAANKFLNLTRAMISEL
jgi:DNA-binding transcriptional LysR family regulator